MANLERNQNASVGQVVNLRLVTYNNNNLANVAEIIKVDIYYQDSTDDSCAEPCGSRRLVQTFTTSDIVQDDTGQYLLSLPLDPPTYVIGKYFDVWQVQFLSTDDSPALIENEFTVYPDLWYASTIPAVYNFAFHFQPNRLRQGSKQWLIIRIDPNVPRATDLQRYYTNLAISSNMRIWIEQSCGPCVPKEQDLRTIVDGDLVSVRDKVFGYYFLDTTDMDCGIYDTWFELNYAGTTQLSPKFPFQVF